MYETFFGLKKRPFLSTPTLDRYFPTECMEHAFRSVSRAIERGEGPVAVMGGTGVGKTMLCLRLADAWRRNFEVVMLSSSKLCTRRALLQNLLFDLRMPYRDMSEGELRLSLTDRLQPSVENCSDGLLLIVDEAQTLSLKLLEELRLLTNLAADGVSRLRLVLVGNLRLDELLGHPRMESLNQRIACRCYLRSLTSEETTRYVKHKIELCGVRSDVLFTEESYRMIHRSADGIPRLIDQVCDHALCLAASKNQKPISASLIEKAWAELQQLPSPWVDPIPTATTASIEFGSLADEDHDDEFEHDETVQPKVSMLNEEVDQDETFFEETPLPIAAAPANEIDDLQPNYAFLSYNSYDIDPSISLETIEAWEDFPVSVDTLNTTSVGSLGLSRTGSTLGTPMSSNDDSQSNEEPFGTDFDSEAAVPPKTERVTSSLDAEEERSLQPSSPTPSIPIEPLEDRLSLEVETVENEIREMITSLHLTAANMDFEEVTDIFPHSTSNYDYSPATHASASNVLDFATLSRQPKQADLNSLKGDDRDLLIVEQDCETITSPGGTNENNTSFAPPHSYVQLFSKLRG
ncbi:MAG: AAA family ATPase [Pirellulales bacterium]